MLSTNKPCSIWRLHFLWAQIFIFAEVINRLSYLFPLLYISLIIPSLPTCLNVLWHSQFHLLGEVHPEPSLFQDTAIRLPLPHHHPGPSWFLLDLLSSALLESLPCFIPFFTWSSSSSSQGKGAWELNEHFWILCVWNQLHYTFTLNLDLRFV